VVEASHQKRSISNPIGVRSKPRDALKTPEQACA
jgi:hypothetical protein